MGCDDSGKEREEHPACRVGIYIITAEQALGQLRYRKVNHQICILNQEIIDRYLIFNYSETV